MSITRKFLIICVCMLLATPVLAGARYIPSTDGTEIADLRTGLIWRRCSEGQTWSGATCTGTASTFTHEQALVQAQKQTGWRLPSVKELGSIADHSLSNPAINATAFPGTPSLRYWASTPAGVGIAWFVDFNDGLISEVQRTNAYYVRLVR
jgi:hypothetical protein